MSGRSYFGEDVPTVVLKHLFQKYDVNSDGKLNESELSTLMVNDLGLTTDQTGIYDWILDKDGDGEISFEEFKAWLNSGEKFKCIDVNSRYTLMIEAIDLFQRYDINKNRTLDWNEFKTLHTDCGGKVENVTAALNYLDKDGNGVISFNEFMKWLNWVDLGNM